MCKEIIYFCAELLNYWSMTFFGLKLFAKVYEINIYKNAIWESVIIVLIGLPISVFSVGNFEYVSYSNGITYILSLYMFIVLKFFIKGKVKDSLSIVIIYVNGLRLIDLWINAVILEANKVSRDIYIDLMSYGLERTIFICLLVVSYYLIYRILIKNQIISYFLDNKFYRRIICIYSHLGVSCFCIVYRFEYREQLIDYWIFYLICAFIMLGAFLFYIVNIKGKEKERVLNIRNDMLEANYRRLQKVYEVNRTLQHDYKNHLLTIGELIKEKKNFDAMNYINTYIICSKEYFEDIKSGNDIIDIVVKCKVSEAKEKGIEFKYEIDSLGKVCMENIDICALLSNLLDNAIEACEKIVDKKTYIQLSIYNRNDMMIIRVINNISYDMTKKKWFFKSEKNNDDLHGWGTKSIDYVIKKYGGEKEYYFSSEKIEIFITIPIR